MVEKAPIPQPISQSRRYRAHWPAWAQALPKFRFPPNNEAFTLVDPAYLQRVLKDYQSEIGTLILDDLGILEVELMPEFRHKDYEAKRAQNQHQLNQILFNVMCL